MLLFTNTMELKATTYRAPYPYLPVITPAKTLYRLNKSVAEVNEVRDQKSSNLKNVKNGEQSKRRTTRHVSFEERKKDPCSYDTNFRSLPKYARKLSENDIMSMMDVESRLSKCRLDRDTDETECLNRRKYLIGSSTIPTSWSLPRETERSWNKSPRPIAELVGTYERPNAPRFERQRSFVNSVTSSSKYPVPVMAESYIQSSEPKK